MAKRIYEIEETLNHFSNCSAAYAYLLDIIAESSPDYFDRDHVRKCEDILIAPPKTATQESDFMAGLEDCKAGYYDKWYRHNRKDDGSAYDDGFHSVPLPEIGVEIIECLHN